MLFRSGHRGKLTTLTSPDTLQTKHHRQSGLSGTSHHRRPTNDAEVPFEGEGGARGRTTSLCVDEEEVDDEPPSLCSVLFWDQRGRGAEPQGVSLELKPTEGRF